MNYCVYGYYDNESSPLPHEIGCVHTIALARCVAKCIIREKHCIMAEVIDLRQDGVIVFVLCKKMRLQRKFNF